MADIQVLVFNKPLVTAYSTAATFTTPFEDVSSARSLTWQAIWTGGTGTFQGQASLDGVDFFNIGGSVASSGSAGNNGVNLPDQAYPYFQVAYTGSGTGTVTIKVSGKS